MRFAEWHAAYPYATHAYDLECLPDDIKKSDLFQKENYAHIDAHALQVANFLTSCYTLLKE